MKIKQINVFLENKIGSLAQVTKLLAENSINIRALSIVDTSDAGTLRIIVNDTERAYNLLKAADLGVSYTDVLVVEIPDAPGGLAAVLALLEKAKINVEYSYAFISRNINNAVVIMRVSDDSAAEKLLKEHHLRLIETDTVDFYW